MKGLPWARISAGVLLVAGLLLGATLGFAPPWWEPTAMAIPLEPGQSRVVGHSKDPGSDELWATAADRRHLALRRDDRGRWWAGNAAARKRVLVAAPEGPWRRVRTWPLAAGDQWRIAGHTLRVNAVDRDGFALEEDRGGVWRFRGGQLADASGPLPPCDPPSTLEGLARGLGFAATDALTLGGGVHCRRRLGLPQVAADALVVAFDGEGFTLSLGPGETRGAGDPLPVQLRRRDGNWQSLHQREAPLTPGTGLIVGYTRYRVVAADGALTLAVEHRARRWPHAAGTPPTPPGMEIAFISRSPGARPALRVALGAAALAALGALLGLVFTGFGASSPGGLHSKAPPPWRTWFGAALAGASLGYYFQAAAASPLAPLLLLGLALGVWHRRLDRRAPGALGLFALTNGLTAVGLLTLLQLGLGAEESTWLRFVNASAALAAAFWWGLWALVNARAQPLLFSPMLDRGLPWFAGLALGLLLLQAFLGNEGGFAGFQPVELAKLALVAVAAQALGERSQRHGWDATLDPVTRWWRPLFPLVLLSILVAFALLFLRDFSPLVLLFVGSAVLVLAYLSHHPRRHRRWLGWLGFSGVAALTLVGLDVLQAHPELFPSHLQSERIAVWADPGRHPHGGYQYHLAVDAIRSGGWWGALHSPVPLSDWPGRNGRVMAVPAVEDDFAPAFFLHRFGGGAGLILAALQVGWLLVFLATAHRALYLTRRPNYRLQERGRFAHFALVGGMGLLVGHFWVAWGTNLGLLPVMGQPMPLLSAAGSHWALFVLPLVGLGLLVEEGLDDQTA